MNLKYVEDQIVKIQSDYLGYSDKFIVQDEFEDISKSGIGRVIKLKEQNKIEVLLVFPHCGFSVPEDVIDYLASNNEEELIDILSQIDTRDIGLSRLIQFLLDYIQKNGLPWAVATHDIHRSLADANRASRDAQFSEITHSKKRIYKVLSEENRAALGADLVDPWIEDLKMIFNRNAIDRIIHFHSYDKKAPFISYQGGDDEVNFRSPFMLMNEYDTMPGIYHENQTRLTGALLKQKEMKMLVAFSDKLLSKYYNIDYRTTVDTAYKMLGSSLGTFCLPENKGGFAPNNSKSTICEIRKDLVTGNKNRDMTSNFFRDFINYFIKL